MFRITQGKGYSMTFPNGWTVSVQWGVMNYCTNRSMDRWTPSADAIAGSAGSPTAEIAAWDQNGVWYDFGADTVKGWVTPAEVLDFMNLIATK